MTKEALFDQLNLYINTNFVEEAFDFVCDEVTDHTQDDPEDPFTWVSESVSCRPVTDSDQELLDEDELEVSFRELFLDLYTQKGIENDDVIYERVPVDRNLINKIRENPDYIPTKPLVILLGMALELKRDEMDLLLKSARYRLSRSHKDELVVAFCLDKGIYDARTIDELLDDQELPLISQRV